MSEEHGPSGRTDGAPPDRTSDPFLWKELEESYAEEYPERGKDVFARERPLLESALTRATNTDHARYRTESVLGLGSSGAVFLCFDTRLKTRRALKIARPVENKEDLIRSLLEEEISRLQELAHPNVVALYDVGVLPDDADLATRASWLPYLFETYLRGAVSAKKYYLKPRTRSDFLKTLADALAGISHLHEQAVVHLDLKPSNIYVFEGGAAVVADLGGARSLKGDPNESLVIQCSAGYAHPVPLAKSVLSTDPARMRGPMFRHELSLVFDLYSLGKTLFELLDLFGVNSPGELDPYTQKFCLGLAGRLMDGRNSGDELPLGLTREAFEELKYASIGEVIYDFGKLSGSTSLSVDVEELDENSDQAIQITTIAKTPVTPRLKTLLDHPLLRRLGQVTQLGMARYIYPTASHYRYEHVIGTYSNTIRYLLALYNDPLNPLFRLLVRPEDVKATLLAAVLHDLGQYAHSHDLEDAAPEVFSHVTLTAALIRGEIVSLQELSRTLRELISKQWRVPPARVLSLLEANPHDLKGTLRDRLLHSIVDGPIDADKLDYLTRDGRICQIAFHRAIDVERLLRTLTIVYEPRPQGKSYVALGIHEKGIPVAESFAFVRYAMFRSVYWHHAVRSAKAMLQRAAWDWVLEDPALNDLRKQELYAFVLNLDVPANTQATLFEMKAFDQPPSTGQDRLGSLDHPEWATLSSRDRQMLGWLYSRTSLVGRTLLESLSTRQLHKRFAVVSHRKSPKLWDALQKVAGDGREVRRLSVALANTLADSAEESLSGIARSELRSQLSGTTHDVAVAATAALRIEGNLLLDVPRSRGAEKQALKYFPEELHRSHKADFAELPTLEDSEVWSLLGVGLHRLAGKVRVFVHESIDPLARLRVWRYRRTPEEDARAMSRQDVVEAILERLLA
jgi:HD superfamily phosphohydrolase